MERLEFEEKVVMRGEFRMKVFKNGELIEEVIDENLIVNLAKDQMARMVAGDFTGRNISRIACGTSNIEPTLNDTTITNQWSKPITGYSFPEIGKVQFNWNLNVNENNWMAIREFGLLTADGKLFARRVRVNPLHKEPDISLDGHWTITF